MNKALLRKLASALLLARLVLAPLSSTASAQESVLPESSSAFPELTAVNAEALPDPALPSLDDPALAADPEVEPDEVEPPAKDEEPPPEEKPVEPAALAVEAGGAQTTAMSFQLPTQPQATVDQSTGALVYEYPIELPKGRSGMTPELSLRHNSRNITRPDSIAGLGWELSIPYIQREPVRGTQNLYMKPFFSSSLSGNLIATTDTSVTPYTTYRPESDDGDYLRYAFNSNNTWTVTGKDGRTYTFGESAASRQDNPSDSSKVYRWMVSKIADTHGNEIQYAYTKDQGQIYPSQIVYTYHAASPAVHTVTFAYTTPGSYGATVYNAAFAVTTAKLLSSIAVTTTAGAATDTYSLTYGDAQFLKQKLLTFIHRYTNFPGEYIQNFSDTTTFSYSTKAAGWEQGSHSLQDYLTPYYDDSIFKDIYTADFDRNGYPDVLASHKYSKYLTQHLMLNSGTQFTDATASWVLPTNIDLSTEYVIVDLNGDRLPDFHPRYYGASQTPPIYLNTGSGFTADASGTWFIKNYVPEVENCGLNVGDALSYYTNTFLYDINKDGIDDVAYFGGEAGFKVYLNNGSGWTQSNDYTFTIKPGSTYDFTRHCGYSYPENNLQMLLDVNGDGLEDYVHASFGTYLNTGSGFAYSAAYSLDILEMSRSGLADLNGDTLIDYVSYKTYQRNPCVRVFLNNGAGFTLVNPTTFPPCTNSNLWTPYELKYESSLPESFGTLMDVTADGFPDIVGPFYRSTLGRVRALNDAQKTWSQNSFVSDPWIPVVAPSKGVFFDINTDGVLDFITPQVAWDGQQQAASKVYMGKPSVPNRLVQINSAFGAQTMVEYGTAPTNYSDTDISPMAVVKKLAVQNIGEGQPTMVIQYAYTHGVYAADPAAGQRRFAGFHRVRATESGSDLTALRVTETYFHQANGSDSGTGEPADASLALVGRPYYSVVKHPSGTPKKETWQRYGTHTLVTEPVLGRLSTFAYPTETVVKTTESSATTGAAEIYTYDTALGERTELRRIGFVTVGPGGSFADIPGNSRYQFTEYATNASGRFVKPSRVEIRTSPSPADTVTRIDYFYDGEPLGMIGSLGNLTKESRWIEGGGATVAETISTHDVFGNVLTVRNPRNATTTYTYDSTKSLVATETNPLNHTTSYQYVAGKLKQITDPNSNVTTLGYSNRGWLYRVTTPANTGNRRVSQWLHEHYDTWIVVRADQPVTERTEFSWQSLDHLGRPVRLMRERQDHATGNRSGFFLREARTYDALGREVTRSAPYGTPDPSNYPNLLAVTVPPNLVTTTTFDVLDRPTQIANALGTTTFAYAGPETTTTDANGKGKRTRTDAYGNIVEVREFSAGSTYTTRYAYDERNLLTGVTDAARNVRGFTYNNAGWLVNSEDLHAPGDSTFGTTSFTYDAVGNQLTETHPNGIVVTRTFDLLDRPTSLTGSTAPGFGFTYTYDSCLKGIGRLCTVSHTPPNDYVFRRSFVYGASAPSSTTMTTLGLNFTTSYQYNLSDEVSRITYPDGTVVRYAFGDWALPSTVYVTLPGGTEATFATATYHHTLKPETVAISGGPNLSYAYDATKLYRTAGFSAVLGTAILQSYDYSYDNLNNVTRVVEPGLTKDYTYDDLSRLTQAVHTPSVGSPTTYTYAYDAIGNITSANGRAYSYSGAGKANPHAVTSIGSDLYAYEENGNVITAPNQIITYNWQNQPIGIQSGGVTTAFAYDETGERYRYQTATATEYQVSEEYLVRGTAPEIVVRLGKVPIGLLAGGAAYSTITDHLGTPVKQISASGVIAESTSYGPFGAALATSGTLNSKRGYTGHEEDADTGLVYAEARYYSPPSHRFFQQDPSHVYLGHQGFQGLICADRGQILLDPQQLNSYSYARNNPTSGIDPTGKKVELVAKGLFGGMANHIFYRVKPDDPSGIHIVGVPAGSKEFTLGAYNPDWGKGLGLNNRLVKEIGLEGVDNASTDFGIIGRSSIVVVPPNGRTDTDLINDLGSAFNSLGDRQNYFMGGNTLNSLGYSNSNNFAYQLGVNVGLQDQLSSFNPPGAQPGFGQSLAPGGQPSIHQSTMRNLQRQIDLLKSRIDSLSRKILRQKTNK